MKLFAMVEKQVNQKNVNSVWLFDPYIDKESLPRLLRILNDMGVKLHVVTSEHKGSNDSTRLKECKTTCEQLGMIFTPDMKIEMISSDAELHDRLLFLCGKNYYPQVYNLSNSLDNIGMNKPSVVCKLDRHIGGQVAEYYFDLHDKMSKEGKLQIIWESQKCNTRNRIACEEGGGELTLHEVVEHFNCRLKECGLDELRIVNERVELPITSSVDELMEKICEDLPGEWEMVSVLIAYVVYPKREELKKYITNNYNSIWTKTIMDKLVECLEKATVDESSTSTTTTVSFDQSFRAKLEAMGYLLEYSPDSMLSHRLRWSGNYAADILMIGDFDAYELLLKQIVKMEDWASSVKREILLYKLADRMAYRDNIADALARKCLQSDVDDLIALGMQWFIKKRDIKSVSDLVKNEDQLHVFYNEFVINLQVEDCRKKYRDIINTDKITDEQWLEKKDFWEVTMQQVKNAWVDIFLDNLTADELDKSFAGLTMRSCIDVCDLVEMLYDKKKISSEEIGFFLNKKLFEKTHSLLKGYWNFRDFHDGKMYLMLLNSNSMQKCRQETIDEMARCEKKVLKELQDVFLPKKDYAKWKWYIDSLIWCFAMRLLCNKDWIDYDDLTKNDGKLLSRQKEIVSILKKNKIILEKYSDAYKILERYNKG